MNQRAGIGRVGGNVMDEPVRLYDSVSDDYIGGKDVILKYCEVVDMVVGKRI